MCVRVGSGFVAIGNGCSVLLVLVKEDHHKMTKLNSKCIINTHSSFFCDDPLPYCRPQKPGDKGWIGRARVPMPSTKGYIVRPKWNMEQEFMKKGSSKKTLNRYEKHLRKKKQEKAQKGSTHAVPISVEGRRMPL